MDAYSYRRADLPQIDGPPALVAASSQAALERAVGTVEATGARIAARLSIEDAETRLDQQLAISAVWVELDEDRGQAMDGLLARIDRDVTHGRYAAVISTSRELLDPVAAQLASGNAELICDADEANRVAALAVNCNARATPFGISDAASDRSAERLRQLSDEVGRIASTLARLSTGPASAQPAVRNVPGVDALPISAEAVRTIIRARRLRARFFREDLFADPAWDMLLDLFQAEISQFRVPVSSLCIAAAVPATTALRWLKAMVSEGLFIRRADPHDGRRVFVELAPEASRALRAYFAEVGKTAVI